MSSPTPKALPAPTFGIITDIQYADIDDSYNFHGTRQRYYRNSLNLLKNAVNYWRDCQPKVDFVLQLGDIIDGKNKKDDASRTALMAVMAPLASLRKSVYHVIGNHECYNFSQDFLLKSALNSAARVNCKGVAGKAFYTFLASPALRIVALDCYEMSVIGTPENTPEHDEAKRILQRNTNADQNEPHGMGTDRRFVAYNGGVTSSQLEWLDQVLLEADSNRENVILIGHIPIFPASADVSCLCWNYEDILRVIYKHSCVSAYMAGHDHEGGSATDSGGILHITFPAVIETEPGNNAFGTATMYCDRIEIVGQGRVPNYSIKLRYPTLIL
ncbi:manganese-dependent ADP-ribose/CDP-alcohol diphosphatase-like [Haliotis rubra]|uniref:manganese-dependent ADP-ribose/CDP-alcohol diphosphatase-like n=1 Tax=Haliotis rubra TaxID=36100 RepID=UPI001EE5FD60|nr:manganese-dependent ADP-ribose/CDP-alcohol diphosphatase-like [Haliotis rubra]